MKCFVHELRTPISTIHLGLNLLKDHDQTIENQHMIRDIMKSVVFIEKILTKFAIIQDGNIELNPFEPFSLKSLITTVETLILYNFKEANVSFTYTIDSNVPEWNYGDIHNIKHVIINLLKNAIKYHNVTRKNVITIHISIDSQTIENMSDIRISVIDMNDSLLPHIKEHLFETFNSTSGSGMGLYICKKIVELHGGNITHNFVGLFGNEFVIVLPLTVCDDISLQVHTPTSNPSSMKMSSTPGRFSVLLVDDSMLNRKMMYKTIKVIPLFGKIYTAEDGADALMKIKNHVDDISLVVLDKNMPVMNGIEAVHKMRTLSYDKLVIGLTGEDSPDEMKEFIDKGADYVIVKPLDKIKINLIHLFLTKYGTDRPPSKIIKMVKDQLEWV